MHIAAYDGIEPHAAVVAHGYFSHHGRIIGQEAVVAELRTDAPY
jgi:hypothetical protein